MHELLQTPDSINSSNNKGIFTKFLVPLTFAAYVLLCTQTANANNTKFSNQYEYFNDTNDNANNLWYNSNQSTSEEHVYDLGELIYNQKSPQQNDSMNNNVDETGYYFKYERFLELKNEWIENACNKIVQNCWCLSFDFSTNMTEEDAEFIYDLTSRIKPKHVSIKWVEKFTNEQIKILSKIENLHVDEDVLTPEQKQILWE